MVTDDGKRVAPPYLDIEEEDSSSDIENPDTENNERRFENLCRICGKVLGNRTIGKSKKNLPALFAKFYDVDVEKDPDFCEQFKAASQRRKWFCNRSDCKKWRFK